MDACGYDQRRRRSSSALGFPGLHPVVANAFLMIEKLNPRTSQQPLKCLTAWIPRRPLTVRMYFGGSFVRSMLPQVVMSHSSPLFSELSNPIEASGITREVLALRPLLRKGPPATCPRPRISIWALTLAGYLRNHHPGGDPEQDVAGVLELGG